MVAAKFPSQSLHSVYESNNKVSLVWYELMAKCNLSWEEETAEPRISWMAVVNNRKLTFPWGFNNLKDLDKIHANQLN